METKCIALRSVPDLGQDYWAQSSRIARCRPSSFVLRIVSVILLVTVVVASGYAEVWVKHSGPGWAFTFGLSKIAFIITLVAGTLAFFLACITIGAAYDQLRWKKALPLKPEGYVPELAETAYHLQGKIKMREDFIRRRTELDEGLAWLSEEIEEGFAYIDDTRKVMDESDIDTLTLST